MSTWKWWLEKIKGVGENQRGRVPIHRIFIDVRRAGHPTKRPFSGAEMRRGQVATAPGLPSGSAPPCLTGVGGPRRPALAEQDSHPAARLPFWQSPGSVAGWRTEDY